MAKPNVYLGETDAKRLARLAVYRRVEELQPISCREEHSAIVLSGPEACEVGCLRYLLKMDAESAYFADIKEKKGLQRAQRTWTGVNTHHGDVQELFGHVPKAAFINLDFCGYLSPERELIVQRMAPHVAEWGLVFYTFYRGRESLGSTGWKVLQEGAKNATSLDGKRLLGTASFLQQRLGSGFVPVFALRYSALQKLENGYHRVGPMAILGFQKVPKGFERNKHWLRMLESPSPYGGYIPGDERLLQEHLRVEALELRRRDLSSHEVASILSLNQGKVAAWFANQTRKP